MISNAVKCNQIYKEILHLLAYESSILKDTIRANLKSSAAHKGNLFIFLDLKSPFFSLVSQTGTCTVQYFIVRTGFVNDHQGLCEALSHPHCLTLKFVQPLLTGFPLVSPFSVTTSTFPFSHLLNEIHSIYTCCKISIL